ncbi:MAG: hypothetical protein HY678_02100 [Chloroflexi bacterium]|nr:hypothetical protein [Chloroflexota bacterium]
MPEPRPGRTSEFRKKLNTPITIDNIEPNTPLKEALGFLSEKFEIPFRIDVNAFKMDLMIVEAENQPVKLPRQMNVPLGMVLRQLVEQCQGTFVVQPDLIEVTTPQRAALKKGTGEAAASRVQSARASPSGRRSFCWVSRDSSTRRSPCGSA